jgi:TolB-like protein/Tfp pilus assembly protein PilF
VSTAKHAVFLSYASDDAEAAVRICEALRAGGIEVWFDRSELRGGDAWDQKIRQQIRSCALFLPLISRNTSARGEGYFRLEWKLAVDRSHLMASDQAFLVPVAIDDSPEMAARVPDEFRAVQWTRLPDGRTSTAFVDRVNALLSGGQSQPSAHTSTPKTGIPTPTNPPLRPRMRPAVLLVAVLAVIALGSLIAKFATQKQVTHDTAPAKTAAVLASNAPGKSIAVLPFVDLSEKKDQEYFSDGLSEELIDHLSHSPDLKVIARTSSFQFKGKNEDVRMIAEKLGVANLLEGSVRTSGHDLRISAQLIRASDGTNLWSQTYDRKLSDIFKVQDEIADTVVDALRATLGRTENGAGAEQNLAAYQFLLQGNFFYSRNNQGDLDRSLELYKKALELDPHYALAWALLARSYMKRGTEPDFPLAELESKTTDALKKALAIDPNLAVAHRWLGRVYLNLRWDWASAESEFERAIALDPTGPDGAAATNDLLATKAFMTGNFDESVRRQAETLARNPLDNAELFFAGWFYYFAGRLEDSLATLHRLLELNPSFEDAHAIVANILLAKGMNDEALAETQKETDEAAKLQVLARVYWAMGRKADARQALTQLEAKYADIDAFDIACVYAERKDLDAAFKWLDRAYRTHDLAMIFLKIHPQLRNLYGDPRYQALLREMNLAV